MQTESTTSRFARMPLKPLGKQPLISVIMSSYNHAPFLGEAVESVLAQTYQRFEIIICDDGSTDNSRAVIERYAQRDSRIRPLYKSNGGQASAWNLAYEASRGEVISFLDSDDLFSYNKLEAIVSACNSHPAAGLLHHRLDPIARANEITGRPIPDILDSGWLADKAIQSGGWGGWASTSGISLRREVADQLFPVPEYLRWFGDVYIAGSAQYLTEFAALPDHLAQYRVHGANASGFDSPTAHSLVSNADHIELTFMAIHSFLNLKFGDAIANRLGMEESLQWYWENLLALYILADKPQSGMRGYAEADMLSHFGPSGKRFWKVLLVLPPGIAWRALQFWWGRKPWWKIKAAIWQWQSRVQASQPTWLETLRFPLRRIRKLRAENWRQEAQQGLADEGGPARSGLHAANHPAHPHGLDKLTPMPLPHLPQQPLVSVIMSSYNYAQFVSEAVESVLRQTYRRFELIICDDGSTDGSAALIQSWAKRDARIQTILKPNGGQASAWNTAFEQAGGDIICFLDPDDLFQPGKLEKVVTTFVAQPRAGVLCHPMLPISAAGKPLGPPFPRDLPSGWLVMRMGWEDWVPSSAICLRREVADRLFPLPLCFRHGYSDAYIQGTSRFLTEIANLSDTLTRYRIHGGNEAGSTVPTNTTVRNVLDGVRDVLSEIRSFVAIEFGDDMAEQLPLEDSRTYWEYHLALYILLGKPRPGVHGYQPHQLLAHIPDSPRKRVWQSLLLLPVDASQRVLQFWWSTASWKRYTAPLTSRLGLR